MSKRNKEKIKSVLLCSGGLDSVCLAHHLKEMLYGDNEEIHALFFDYGQKSLAMERRCSKKVAEKLGMKWYEIKLPKFTWTTGSFYAPKFDGEEMQYLEFRNMIFISYAFSYAQSIGASEIYTGFFRDLRNQPYIDASPEFVGALNMITPDIQVIAPFFGGIKKNLLPLITHYGITPDDFFSCDYPVNGKPCGECTDCQNFKELFGKNY